MLISSLFCFSVFPIFGRPRELPPDSRSDFGKHIDALGSLLERTVDREFARSRLMHYRQTVGRDAGTSPFKPQERRTATERIPTAKTPPSSDPEPAGRRPASEQR